VRHKVGIEHFCQSQRTDIAGIERDELPQNSLVKHICYANAQAIINISRKRLCNKASKETREAWQIFLNALKEYEPEIVNACKKECDYRNGICPEFKSCKL
jgi:thymidylate synthase ThyX